MIYSIFLYSLQIVISKFNLIKLKIPSANFQSNLNGLILKKEKYHVNIYIHIRLINIYMVSRSNIQHGCISRTKNIYLNFKILK